ncbi:PLDc N-terminal domain-containing protein [Pseudochelatococcus sp. G4_1912]|uniref:PLDc N-terminal domain-containing protein n=1 Tax=Pseudochelatococcus sp. G4_1912 TaxID=3114288 RepID=UPI0039C69320
MLFEGGFNFSNFIVQIMAIFVFILWFWLLITVFGDLFRRQDISGWGKVFWVIGLIIFPYLGIFIYLLTQGNGMAERAEARAKHMREELRHTIGFSVADELEKLDRLKAAGSITAEEYSKLRARVVQ